MQVVGGPNFRKHKAVNFDGCDHLVGKVSVLFTYIAPALSLVPLLNKYHFSREYSVPVRVYAVVNKADELGLLE